MTILDRLTDRTGLEQLWALLPEARLVGGSVRDLLLGRQDVHDLDLATPEPPETVQRLLGLGGIKTVPTGLSHGTVTAIIDRVPFEITTLRRDVSTDGRHAQVSWTSDWSEDAARRDFTINAMSCDRHGTIHDYFDGQGDLQARRVRFVGNAGKRIEEDALRILRFFRFDARFGAGGPDEEAMSAIALRADLVSGLSAERLASEMLRILEGPDLGRTLRYMQKAGVLDLIVEAPQLSRLERALEYRLPVDGILRLGILSDAPGLAERLRLSGKQAQRLAHMHRPAGTPEDGPDVETRGSGGIPPYSPTLSPDLSEAKIRVLLSHHDRQSLIDRSWYEQTATPESGASGLDAAQWDTLRERLSAADIPVFPIAGRDVIAAGVKPGPEVGLMLARLAGWWREEACMPDREACLAALKAQLPLSERDTER